MGWLVNVGEGGGNPGACASGSGGLLTKDDIGRSLSPLLTDAATRGREGRRRNRPIRDRSR